MRLVFDWNGQRIESPIFGEPVPESTLESGVPLIINRQAWDTNYWPAKKTQTKEQRKRQFALHEQIDLSTVQGTFGIFGEVADPLDRSKGLKASLNWFSFVRLNDYAAH